MTPTEIGLYAQIFVTAGCAIAYVMTYRYQSDKLATMDRTVKNMTDLISGQSKIIGDFEKYKSVFDIDDFEKRLTLKLDNQKMELDKQFRKEAKLIFNKTVQNAKDILVKETPAYLKKWDELAQIAISIELTEYPTKADKAKRDEHIKNNYPQNAELFIGFIDAYLDGQLKTTDHSQ